MKKVIYAGGIFVLLTMVAVWHGTRVEAQDWNRFTLQAPFPPLVGPGSSIGITVRDADTGVVVQEVRGDTPASRAGLKEGDIVTEFDGERARSAAQFTSVLSPKFVGKIV
jgi:S1-C subfamily serine protease